MSCGSCSLESQRTRHAWILACSLACPLMSRTPAAVPAGWGFQGLLILLAVTSALSSLRRYAFRVWYWMHVFMALATIAFAICHTATLVAIGFAAWLIDLAVRYVWMASEWLASALGHCE